MPLPNGERSADLPIVRGVRSTHTHTHFLVSRPKYSLEAALHVHARGGPACEPRADPARAPAGAADAGAPALAGHSDRAPAQRARYRPRARRGGLDLSAEGTAQKHGYEDAPRAPAGPARSARPAREHARSRAPHTRQKEKLGWACAIAACTRHASRHTSSLLGTAAGRAVAADPQTMRRRQIAAAAISAAEHARPSTCTTGTGQRARAAAARRAGVVRSVQRLHCQPPRTRWRSCRPV